MSFAERTKNPPLPRNLCPVGRVLYQLDDAERAELEAMLASKTPKGDWRWPTSGEKSVQEAIEEEGYGRVNEKSIRMHRGAKCGCAA